MAKFRKKPIAIEAVQWNGQTIEPAYPDDKRIYEGGMASALEVTMNAKGLYQYSAKLYFRDVEDLLARGCDLAEQLDRQFRAAFPTPSER